MIPDTLQDSSLLRRRRRPSFREARAANAAVCGWASGSRCATAEPSSLLPLSLEPGGDNNGAVLGLVPRLGAWLDRPLRLDLTASTRFEAIADGWRPPQSNATAKEGEGPQATVLD